MRVYVWENCQEETAWLSTDNAAISDEGFCGSPLRAQWAAPAARVVRMSDSGERLRAADFTLLDMSELAISETAKARVGDFLEQYGELLPVEADGEMFYAYNVTTLLPALDEAGSKVESDDYEGARTILWISEFSFKSQELAGAEVFKLDIDPCGDVYLTESAFDRLRTAGLSDENVMLVWDDAAV